MEVYCAVCRVVEEEGGGPSLVEKGPWRDYGCNHHHDSVAR